MADTFWKGFSVWKLSPSNRPKTELFGEKKCGKSPAAARRPLSLVFRAMLSLGLAREGLVCLRENLRTQGLRFQERVGQVNFRYARGVILKVSGRCVHLGWQIASETKKAKCLVQAPGRTLEAVSWLKIYSKKRPSQLQCSRANLARVPSKVPVWVCDLYFYNCE